MTPAKKLAIVAALQFVVLLSIVGFKQYTIWTSETVLLKVQPIDTRYLGRDSWTVEYDISRLDPMTIAWDDSAGRCCDIEVYVELEQEGNGYWSAVAVHDSRTRTRDGTVLIKANAQSTYGLGDQRVHVRYGIERLVFAEGVANQTPSAVEVRVDLFGNATPRYFLVDGRRVKIKSH